MDLEEIALSAGRPAVYEHCIDPTAASALNAIRICESFFAIPCFYRPYRPGKAAESPPLEIHLHRQTVKSEWNNRQANSPEVEIGPGLVLQWMECDRILSRASEIFFDPVPECFLKMQCDEILKCIQGVSIIRQWLGDCNLTGQPGW